MQQAVILDGEQQKEIFFKILEIIAKIPSLYHYDSYKSIKARDCNSMRATAVWKCASNKK